jgi:hypothetical protein
MTINQTGDSMTQREMYAYLRTELAKMEYSPRKHIIRGMVYLNHAEFVACVENRAGLTDDLKWGDLGPHLRPGRTVDFSVYKRPGPEEYVDDLMHVFDITIPESPEGA